MADVSDGFALGYQLIGRFELADDLLRRVPGAFHGEIPGLARPDRIRTLIHPGPISRGHVISISDANQNSGDILYGLICPNAMKVRH